MIASLASKKEESLRKPTAQFTKDFKEVEKLCESLELQLRRLKKKLRCLEHDPFIVGPKKPRPKK
jgi:hypothetical protein